MIIAPKTTRVDVTPSIDVYSMVAVEMVRRSISGVHCVRRPISRVLLIAACLLLGACKTLSGMPRSSVTSPTIATAGAFTLPGNCRKSATLGDTYTKKQRNAWIETSIICVDDTYNKLATALQRNKAAWAIAGGILDLGLNVASSLTPSAGVKANYAAASTLLTGSRDIIDKEAFLKQTVAALTAAMNAKRKEVLVHILRGMQAETEEYPLAIAYGDLLAYQRAGSFLGGLSFVETASQEQLEDSIADIEDIAEVEEMSEAAIVIRGCLTKFLQKMPETEHTKLFASIQAIDSKFKDTGTIAELVRAIIETKRDPKYQRGDAIEKFDKELIVQLTKAGINVTCEEG